MKRGDLYWADVVPRSGSEQTGRRPVIVMSNDGFNQTLSWNSIIVVPLTTSRAQALRTPTVVAIPGAATGLPKGSIAICHQVTTLDRSKFRQRIGNLPHSLMEQVGEAVKAAMDLD